MRKHIFLVVPYFFDYNILKFKYLDERNDCIFYFVCILLAQKFVHFCIINRTGTSLLSTGTRTYLSFISRLESSYCRFCITVLRNPDPFPGILPNPYPESGSGSVARFRSQFYKKSRKNSLLKRIFLITAIYRTLHKPHY
jgi:hypothetical protein